MRRYASSTDVARLAGVSQSAVSRTYRPGGSVSPETRRKVLEAAEALGYRPSMIPQIMLGHRSRLVAIVIGGMYNPFNAGVLEEFTVKLQAIGHQVLLVHVDSGHTLDAVIPRLASYRVDAIVSALAILSPRAADELARFKIPVITFNTPVKNEWVSSVSCDNEGAGRGPGRDAGRARREEPSATSPARPAAPPMRSGSPDIRKGLAAHGVTALKIATGDFRYEGGFARRAGTRRRPALRSRRDLLRQRSHGDGRHRRDPHEAGHAGAAGHHGRRLRQHPGSLVGRL